MEGTTMRSDIDIKRDVESELRWSPQFDETDMAIKVKDGVVMLSGFARNYYDKYEAESAVKRVKGVAGVANDLQVRLASGDGLADPEIARAAVTALKSALPVACGSIKVIANEGRLTLEGSVEWNFQKQQAERVVRYLKGVTAVDNVIRVTPRVAPAEVKRRIEEAFRRNAEIDAEHVSVTARDGEVTLTGTVRSWAEHDEAQQTAWSAPGVTQVKNDIRVRV
jgi:osmotically-inducible protein OsmY